MRRQGYQVVPDEDKTDSSGLILSNHDIFSAKQKIFQTLFCCCMTIIVEAPVE